MRREEIRLHSVHHALTGYNRFFSTSSPLPPPPLTYTRPSPVAQAGHRTSSVPVGPGSGTPAGAAESQPPASSSSPPASPSPSPPPADGCTPLVSVIHSGRREEGGGR